MRPVVAALVAALLFPAAALAADYSAYGLAASPPGADGTLVLDDGRGFGVELAAASEPAPERLRSLAALLGALHDWPELSVSRIVARDDGAELQVTVQPSALLVDGESVLASVPGGLVFWCRESVEYDFRLLSGAFAIRLSAPFASGGELAAAIREARKDPVGWLLRRDPQYAARLAAELSLRVDALEKAEAARTEVLEAALMTALNVGFLRGPTPIAPESVAWVVGKKAAEPGMTKAELVRAAREEKVKLGDKEIGIILLVKYGER